MKNQAVFFLILSFLIFQSCLNDGKMAVEKNNTTVYYDIKEDQVYAERLLDFWIRNNFDGKRKQSLKLTREKNNKSFILKVIVTENFQSQQMPFEDIKLFNEIQSQLNEEIFINIPSQIAVCDKYFNILTIPNKINL